MKGIYKKIAAFVMVCVMMSVSFVSAATITPVQMDTYIKPDYTWAKDSYTYDYPEFFGVDHSYDDDSTIYIVENTQKGTLGVTYKNIGSYYDNSISAKVTLMDWVGTEGYVYFDYDMDYVNFYGDLEQLKIKVEYFVTGDETQTPIAIKGNYIEYDMNGMAFIVDGDFVDVYVENEDDLTCEKVEEGTKYTCKSDAFMVTYDTALTDNALELTIIPKKNVNGHYEMPEDWSFGGFIFEGGYTVGFPMNMAAVDKEAVTQGDTLAYDYVLYYPYSREAREMSVNSISPMDSVITIPIDQVLEVTNVKVMDLNHNDLTEFVKIQTEEDGVVLSTAFGGRFISDIAFVHIDTKVKDFPKLNPEQYVDGKYLLKSSVDSTYKSVFVPIDVDMLSIEDYKEPLDNEMTFTVESNVVETELYYRTNVKSLNCEHSGEGVNVATTNNSVVATPNKGYYITKVVIDGEEMDISNLEKGAAFECVFEFINSNHEVLVEALPLENPDTSDINVAMQVLALATSAAGVCLTSKKRK